MPRKAKKASPAREADLAEEDEADAVMDAEDDGDDDGGPAEEDPWHSKEELEALEAELDPESLLCTEAKEQRYPPPTLVLPLLPYQREFLAWGVKQELGPIRGGILADEMGMGKTLQAVSLIMTHPHDGVLLGPDSGAPAAPATPEAATPAPKLRLRVGGAAARDALAGDAPAAAAEVPTASVEAAPQTPGRAGQVDRTSNDDVAAVTPALTSASAPPAGPAKASVSEGKASRGKGKRKATDVAPAKSAPKGRAAKSKAAAASADAEEAPPPANKGRGKKAAATAAAAAEGDAAADGAGETPEAPKKKGARKAAKPKKARVDPLKLAMEQAKTCHVEEEDAGVEGFCKATLIVCPVVAAMQWRQEILRYTTPGTMNIVLYHGANRAHEISRDELEDADVVLTTFSILEVDYRKNLMAPKASCAFCGKKFQPERLKVHLRYFCGPYAEKTEAQAKQHKKGRPGWMKFGKKKADDAGKGGKSGDGASTSAAAAADDDDEPPLKKSKAASGAAKPAKSGKSVSAIVAEASTSAAAPAAEPAAAEAGAAAATAAAEPTAAAPAAEPAPSARRSRSEARSEEAGDCGAPKRAASTPTWHKTSTSTSPAPRRARRSASAAAGRAAAADVSGDEADSDDDPAPRRKQASAKVSSAKRGGREASATKARGASKGKLAGAKRKRPAAVADSDASASDWAPDTDDDAVEAADAVATDSEETVSLVDSAAEEEEVGADGAVSAAAVEEDAALEDDLAEDEGDGGGAAAKGGGKAAARKKSKEEKAEEEALDAEVAAAAQRMIDAAIAERSKQAQGTSVLHDIRWRRVILDEAHSIKDRRCNTAQAAFALSARYRWCLSGTPLQNRVNELYSLVRFLRIHPYSHYFADKTGCVSLDFPFKRDLRKCDLCGGSRMSHYCWWNRRIANPIKFCGYEGRGRTALMILKHQILPKVLLRRTKMDCAGDLALPPRRLVVRKDPFDAREADFYEALYTQSQAAFGGYVDTGTVLNNYAHIFDLLIRLRQAVNHPYLVVYSASGGRNDNAPGGAAPPGAAAPPVLGVCGVCHDPLEDGIAAACGHTFCRVCVTEYLDNAVGACTCPTCERPLTIDLDAPAAAAAAASPAKPGKGGGGADAPARARKSSILSRMDLGRFQSSTKLEALHEEMDAMLRADASAKCIVFSQFTSMLDLVHFRLQQVGIKCVKLEGSMSLDKRNKTIAAFNTDPTVTCFLMSLKAGGVALNLTVASHVMLMDPWWNPAVEQQAQDRIHRLGQFKPISVTRFIVAGTIEERILKLQEKKQLVFEGTVGKDAEALGKLTVDDLRFLFG